MTSLDDAAQSAACVLHIPGGESQVNEGAPSAGQATGDIVVTELPPAETAPTETAPTETAPTETAPTTADIETKTKPEGYYYVVSSSNGFVAAYYGESAVRENVLKKFSLLPFVVQRFKIVEGPVDVVWVVLFSSNDAVAFVSNSRDEAERVRAGYARIGLAYEDPIDFWERKVGVITETTLEFLSATNRAHEMYAGPAVAEEREKQEQAELARLNDLLSPIPDGPISRALREMERISIFDGVVDLDSCEELEDATFETVTHEEATHTDTPPEEEMAIEPIIISPTSELQK